MTFRRDLYPTRTHEDTMKLLRELYNPAPQDEAVEYAIDAMNDSIVQAAPDDVESAEDFG